jgi:CRP-like cAMP-binding protein
MDMPTRPPGPHDLHRSPDTGPVRHDSANRGGWLSNLTLSIGNLIFRCILEIKRVDDLGPGSAETQMRPSIRNRRRHMLRPGTSDGPQASLIGSQNMPHEGRIEGSPLSIPRQRDGANVAFWEALDPIEREAYRSVAFSRTFAAGARLIREGERADHVIVILSGRTNIVVAENGAERVLAERGPGQLVGERGALQVSVRSASVIALETVQALVVRTADFAAFISAHPAVLKIVESQLYDRLTEQPDRPHDVHSILADETTTADRLRSDLYVGRPLPRSQPLNGENCTIILSDVAGFGARTRTDEDRRIIREALFGITHAVLQEIPDVWSWDDRGDGLLTVIPPSVPTARVIEQLHRELPPALEEHNRVYHEGARIQLRVAISVGPVASDRMGVSGEAIIVTARLVEAPVLKKAMETSRASLGVIASMFIFETVIRHARSLSGYSEVQVNVKESSFAAWMKLFGTTPSSEFNRAVAS